MVPPESVSCFGVCSLISTGAAGAARRDFGAGVSAAGFASGFDLGWGFGFGFVVRGEAGFEAELDLCVGTGAPSMRRSSLTVAVVSRGRHSAMAPAWMGVMWSCSTGEGAAAAAANASFERPAVWPLALRMRT